MAQLFNSDSTSTGALGVWGLRAANCGMEERYRTSTMEAGNSESGRLHDGEPVRDRDKYSMDRETERSIMSDIAMDSAERHREPTEGDRGKEGNSL